MLSAKTRKIETFEANKYYESVDATKNSTYRANNKIEKGLTLKAFMLPKSLARQLANIISPLLNPEAKKYCFNFNNYIRKSLIYFFFFCNLTVSNVPALMKPLASAWAIFPPPTNPILSMLVLRSKNTFFLFSSTSARRLSLTVLYKRKITHC